MEIGRQANDVGLPAWRRGVGRGRDEVRSDNLEPRAVYIVDMVPRGQKSDLLRAQLYLDAETYLYLCGEFLRDQSPGLSWAIWTKGNESPGAKGLVLADDLYFPDDRANTFMWLDMSQRQNFEDDISENLFNPKAAQ